MSRLSVFLLLPLVLLTSAGPTAVAADELSEAYEQGLELFRQERYDDALPHFELALSLAEQHYGAGDPRVAVELNNLAEVYRVLNRLEEAEPLYVRAVELDERSLGSDDPGLATSLNNLALLYRAQNRLAEAEQLYERSLDILEKALGPRHPNVAKSLNNLAVLYDAQGRRDRARPLIARAVEVATETLGDAHPTTITLMKNLETMASEPIIAVDAGAQAQIEPAAGNVEPGFSIHLSSVRSVASANSEWIRLADSLGLPQNWPQRAPERVDIAGKGTFYRVAGGAFPSRDAAARACTDIKAKGQYCAVLPP